MLSIRLKQGEDCSFTVNGEKVSFRLMKIERSQIQLACDAPIECRISRTRRKKKEIATHDENGNEINYNR